jgi:hypothetical protein
MNLEKYGCHKGQGPRWKDGWLGLGCPDGGCDYVAIYDGASASAKLIAKYSGQPTHLPVIVSSSNTMTIHFQTDTRNCGIAYMKQKGDPGWFADWDFLDNGQNICHPDAAVLTQSHGVLHDDATAHVDCSTGICNHADKTHTHNGYSDNLDCGVRIRAPKGATINLHISQMNLESCSLARKAGYRGKCATDPDRLMVYDGRNAQAKLLAAVSGDITDSISQRDTWTSSGRDLFVRFKTDTGNWGLSPTKDDPGFYAEWQFVADGQACAKFTPVPKTAIRGHNSEILTGVKVPQCEAACCKRDWCKSFDFSDAHPTTSGGVGYCALSDVDASRQYGDINHNADTTLYERRTLSSILCAFAVIPDYSPEKVTTLLCVYACMCVQLPRMLR